MSARPDKRAIEGPSAAAAAMTRPNRYLFWMMTCLVAVSGLAFVLQERLISAFQHNAALNSGILAALLIGICFIFWQVGRLYPEVRWIEHYRRGEGAVSAERTPRLLAPMAAMIGHQRGRLSLSTTALRSLLDGINARLDESHEISRYLIALLVFLGLLGTFWGLLATINSVGEAVGNLAVGSGDPATMFSQLKEGLRAPLTGMGTAFGASMFGLAGSLVLGFLELQATQAHNRFFNELELWLASQTRLSTVGPSLDGDQPGVAFLHSLLDQTNAGLETLRALLDREADTRGGTGEELRRLNDQLASLGGYLLAERELVGRLAAGQDQTLPVLARLAAAVERDSADLDEVRRLQLRAVESQAPGRAQLPAVANVEPLLRHTAESLEVLRHGVARSEASRAQANSYLKSMTEGLQALARQITTMQHSIDRLADERGEVPVTASRAGDGGGRGYDDGARTHLRNIETYMSRMAEHSVPAHLQALLMQTAESLERLHRTLGDTEQGRARSDNALRALAGGVERLSEHLAGERPMMAKLLESQTELRAVLQRLADGGDRGGGLDEMTRQHIRNIDAYLSRMLEEMSVGRQHTVQELRNELKQLARSLVAVGADERRR